MLQPDARELLVRAGWNGFDAVYLREGGNRVAKSGSSEVRRWEDPLLGPVYLKRYWASRPSQLLKLAFRGGLLGRTKARREYEQLVRFHQAGLGVPEPLAWGEERRYGAVVRSFLLTRGIPGAVQLDHFLAGAGASARKSLIAPLAGQVRSMHAQELTHGDLYFRNILVSPMHPGRFFFLDSHPRRKGSPLEERRRADLAMLDSGAIAYFSRADRMRFYLCYAGKSRLEREDREVLRRIAESAGRERQKLARRTVAPMRQASA